MTLQEKFHVVNSSMGLLDTIAQKKLLSLYFRGPHSTPPQLDGFLFLSYGLNGNWFTDTVLSCIGYIQVPTLLLAYDKRGARHAGFSDDFVCSDQ